MESTTNEKLGERRVSPALGDFALQERGKLIAENARLRAALIYLVNAHEHPAATSGPRGVLDHVPPALKQARAALNSERTA